jgi:DNA ligase-4
MFCYRLKGGLQDIVKMMNKGRPNVDPLITPLEPGAYGNGEFIIEEKLDGERIQLHKVGSDYRYFSR